MCGLAGCAGDVGPDEIEQVSAMTAQLVHRGPDTGMVKAFEGAVLGHRRLRIIDLHPAADQPMTGEDGRFWVVFNGEIYNFPELRRSLEGRGHRFVSDSDTEVIVHLVEDHGDSFAEHLRGMFAIAVWDRQERALTLVRDRLGIKPLYYQPDAGRLWFSSEARTLPGAKRWPLDEYSIAAYLHLGWVPGPRSAFRDVLELPAGHRLRFHDRDLTVERWWQPDQAGPGPSGGLDAALADAVERHLVADVPVGLFLSGGLDSAAIATLAARSGASGVVTAYTVAFEDAPDESGDAARLARRLGLAHQIVAVTGEEIAASVEAVVAALDQPSVDGLNSWVVCRAARRAGAVVALSGVGGDELFAGYSTFRHVPRLESVLAPMGALPVWLRATPSAVAALSQRTAHTRTARVFDSARAPGWASAYAAVRGVLCPSEIEAVRGGWGRDLRRHPPVPEPTTAAGRVAELEAANYLPYQLLRDTDAMSMAHSLEVRVPLLDDRVVAAARAGEAPGPRRTGKEILAEAVDVDLLAIARAPKRTFTLPLDVWLRGPLRQWSTDTIAGLSDAGLGFDRRGLDQLCGAFHAGRANWRPIWALSVLGQWLQGR